MQSDRYQRFGAIACLYVQGLKMKATVSSETLVNIFQSTRCPHSLPRVDLKLHILYGIYSETQ